MAEKDGSPSTTIPAEIAAAINSVLMVQTAHSQLINDEDLKPLVRYELTKKAKLKVDAALAEEPKS